MRLFLEQLRNGSVNSELVDAAAAWWELSEDSTTCLILVGGWDECVSSFASITPPALGGVVVSFPASSLQYDEKRGFVRYRGTMEEIRSSYRKFPLRECRFNQETDDDRIMYQGGQKFFPGMLDQRSIRLGRKPNFPDFFIIGELAHAPCGASAGIPSCSLGVLHNNLCHDIREGSRASTSPSLVRMIQNARFLGVSFCQVYPECSKCFEKLVRRRYKKMRSAKTYWNQPLESGKEHERGPVQRVPESNETRHRKTSLVCPNGCDEKKYYIRWETSGVIDDSTGQAKLYAERAAAVTLLGLEKDTIQRIEEGVWNIEGGLIYSRSVPAKPHIRDAVELAKMTALAHSKSQAAKTAKRVCVDKESILRYMNPASRAEYLLQSHCRRSTRPFRPLIYYVRCKPLSDQVHTVNHAEISVAMACEEKQTPTNKPLQRTSRKSVTYALPPLKLNLVDMATALPYHNSV
jgi:hypothetical protein